jgi:HlyD family secretion protein
MAALTRRWLNKRTFLVVGASVALVAIAFFVVRGRGTGKEPRFETTPVQRGRLIARVTATGTLSALVTVQVGSQVSGRLQQINVDFNSPVTKGQLIAKIDPQLFEAAVEQARANYLAAKGNLAKAKVQALDAERQLTRAKSLLERQLIAQADYDTQEANKLAADAQVEVSVGAVEQARAALHQTEVNMAYTSIISPIHGVVISRNVDVGQTVAASLQAPTLFTIAEDLKKMEVHTNVAEADVGKLSAGMLTAFTVDAYPTEVFKGRIRQIRNAPQTVQNVVTYDAVIDVDNGDLKLKPGMTTNVTVVYAEKDDVLKVPNAALRFKPGPEFFQQLRVAAMERDAGSGPARVAGRAPGEARRPQLGRTADGSPGALERTPTPNEKTIWILRDSFPQAVSVLTGLSDGTVSEVVSGPLTEGDQTITALGGEPGRGGPPGGPQRGPRFF